MGRLRTAYDKQREYAKKEYLSGDEKAGDEHEAKAEAFLERLLAGEDGDEHEAKAEAFLERLLAGEDGDAPAGKASVAADEPLSPDPAIAQVQILAEMGFDSTATLDPASLLGTASEIQNQRLVLLGLFGTPDDQATFPEADYTLFEEFSERAPAGQSGYQGWQPKDMNKTAWAAYVDTLD